MTAYTITGNCNIRQLGTLSPSGSATARTGGDTIVTNGFNFTIDQDTRNGLTGTTSTSFGNMTVSAALGGRINIDGRFSRLIPYTGGSGTITVGTTITMGSGTGIVVGLYTTALNAAPVLTGVAAGFIKVAAWNNVAFPTSGSFTQAGFTFTISGTSVVGWVDVVGDEGGTITANRLGSVNITGEWYAVGTTTGVANQTMQIPNNGLLKYAAGVFIEKTAGVGDYEFYPNAGTAITIGTEIQRGKVVWIDANGLVRIGHNGTANMGYTPVAGLAVVIGNVFMENCTTVARTANVIPNAAVATRYDFTTTGGGVIVADKCNFAWYPSFAQAYSVQLTNCGIVDALLVTELASPVVWSKVGVGNKPTTALVVSPLTMSLNFAGGSITDCVWSIVSMTASGNQTATITDIANFTFLRNIFRGNTIRGNSNTFAINGTRVIDCVYTDCTIIQGAASLTTCNRVTFTNLTFIENVSGTTVATFTSNVWSLLSNTLNCVFNGLLLPLTNCQPFTALLSIAAAGCSNIKMRNIGTRVSPQNLGSVNNTGLIYTLAAGAAASNIKIQRVYCSNTRTGIMTGDNSSTGIIEENVFGDYADAVDVMPALNQSRKGMGGTGALTAQTAVYGTHWLDLFTSTTAGRIAILMNESSTLTLAQVSLTAGAGFTSAGGLYMPVIGQTATFESPDFIIGHTAFTNTALVMAGGTSTNYTYEWSINKNDGSGFSTLTSATYTAITLGTALSGIAGISASLGFKLRLKITTSLTNATAITSVYVTTVSTTTAQDFQYPLDVAILELTSLKANSEIRAYTGSDPITAVEIGGVESSGTTFSFTHSAGGVVGYIQILANGFQNITLPITYSTSNQSIPIQQQLDRQYFNPI